MYARAVENNRRCVGLVAGSGKRQGDRRKSCASDGFTLIELLIAVVLLSLMMTVGSLALRNLLLSLDKISSPYPQEAIAFFRLQTVLHGIYPYVENAEVAPTNQRRLEPRFFFQGGEKQCLFVTTASLKGDKPAICRIYHQEDTVFLEEGPLYSADNNFLTPAEFRPSAPVVLFRGVSELTFQYQYRTDQTQGESFPATITMVMQDSQGRVTRHIFVIRSRYMEKLRIIELLQSNS